jgi:hypothetical protein
MNSMVSHQTKSITYSAIQEFLYGRAADWLVDVSDEHH